MRLAYRGVVDSDGDIVVWPTLLADHSQAFRTLWHLKDYRARFRQWNPGEEVDFDAGASDDDKSMVEDLLTQIGAL